MIQKNKTFTYLCGGLLAGMSLLGAGLGEAQVVDGQVSAVTYFPTPYVRYSNINIGKKLDIGVTHPFTASLGSEFCDGNINQLIAQNGAMNELPSLWTPNPIEKNDVSTPLLLRAKLPDGTTAANTVLDLNGLHSRVAVNNVEVGQRAQQNATNLQNLTLAETTPLGEAVNVQFSNLNLGNASSNSSSKEVVLFDKVEVTEQISAPFYVVASTAADAEATRIRLPACITAEEGNEETGRWHWQDVRFAGKTYTAMVCGTPQKLGFDTQYQCFNGGNAPTGPKLRCEVNGSNNFYCNSDHCATWLQYQPQGPSYTLTLLQDVHNQYCTWLNNFALDEQPTPAEKEAQLIRLMMGENRIPYSTEVDTAWYQTGEGQNTSFFVVTVKPNPGDVTCYNNGVPNENLTPDRSIALSFQRYQKKPYVYTECIATCESAN